MGGSSHLAQKHVA